MVDVQQVAVQVEVRVAAGLDGRVRGLIGRGAGGEVELCKDGKGRQGDARDALCGEFLGVDDDDLLDVRVGRLLPVGDEGSHCWWWWWWWRWFRVVLMKLSRMRVGGGIGMVGGVDRWFYR